MQSVLTKPFARGIFSPDRVNTRRQIELDLLKTIAVFVMIADHTITNVTSYYEAEMTLFDTVILYVSQVVNAALFMIPMGMSIHYSRHTGVKALAMRGVALLSVGQLLVLLRDILPNAIGLWVTGNPYFLMQFALIFSVDIMQLAGLTFLLFALLRKLKLKGPGVFLTGCVLSVVGTLMRGVETGNYLVDQLLGFFWATKTESFFPLFNWFIYPAFGYWFGEVYLHVQDKDKLYNRIMLICFPLALVYFTLRYSSDFLHLGDLLLPSMLAGVIFPDALFTILLDIALLGLVYKVTKLFKGGKLPAAIAFPAKHINKYYCISWVLIKSLGAFLLLHGGLLEDELLGYVAVLAILAACTLIILFYERFLRKFFSSIPKPVVMALFALIWVISIAVAAWAYPQLTEYPNYLNNYMLDQLDRFFPKALYRLNDLLNQILPDSILNLIS